MNDEQNQRRVPSTNLIDLDAYRARRQGGDDDPQPPSGGVAGLPVPAQLLDLNPTGRAA